MGDGVYLRDWISAGGGDGLVIVPCDTIIGRAIVGRVGVGASIVVDAGEEICEDEVPDMIC